tara:strand:- start:1860 stop:2582 length:723 start_codon:yes stop_codon:yes gene_type:complete
MDITIQLIMDRLTTNPLYKGLKVGTVASYMKDFASINAITPLLVIKPAKVIITDYKGELPDDFQSIESVYLCNDGTREITNKDGLDPSRFEDNRLGASTTDNILRKPADGEIKDFYGAYMIQSDIITIDLPEAILEIHYKGMNVDAQGFPTFKYDGSLMLALTNFVKWQHLIILNDSEMVSSNKVTEASKEYLWYVGQYTSRMETPDYDEAVSWANSWTRLVDTRNKSQQGRNIQENYKL